MKIQKDDLYSQNSLTVALLNQLSKEKKSLYDKAERINSLEIMLVNAIQENKITDTDEINDAISWFYHSNLSPIEILRVITEERK